MASHKRGSQDMAGVGADDRQGQEIGASMWIMGKGTSA